MNMRLAYTGKSEVYMLELDTYQEFGSVISTLGIKTLVHDVNPSSLRGSLPKYINTLSSETLKLTPELIGVF